MKNGKVQAKDIQDQPILEYLAKFQGQWTSLWNGYFKGREDELHMGKKIGIVNDVYYAMPEGTPKKVALAKMKSLHKKGLVGGCTCGCRGDFEITDLGLELIGQERTKRYTGY